MIVYALQEELTREREHHAITRSKLAQAELLLMQSQQEVAKQEGEKRELVATIEEKEAIIATLVGV